MAEIRQTEYQDRNGNIYHFHTDSEIVKYNDTTVKKYLDSLEKNNIGSPIIEATGTNNYIGSSARITSIGKGTKCTLFIENDSTGNCTLNINGLGINNIKDSNGNIVTNLKANIPYNLCHNGSDFILQGKGGGGNLIPKYLLAGYYGEGDNGRVDGAMVNRGTPTATLNCGGTYNISEGYYGGGKITANSLKSQTSANATAAQILSGYTAWVNGNKVTGTATLQSLGGVHGVVCKTYFVDNKVGTVSFNLGFQPKLVFIVSKYNDSSTYYNGRTMCYSYYEGDGDSAGNGTNRAYAYNKTSTQYVSRNVFITVNSDGFTFSDDNLSFGFTYYAIG